MEKKLQELIHSTIIKEEKPQLMHVLESIAVMIESRWSVIIDFVKQYSSQSNYTPALLLCKVLSDEVYEKLEKELTPSEKSQIQQLMKKSDKVNVDLKGLRDLEIKIKKTMIGLTGGNEQLRKIVTSLSHGDIMAFCNKHPTMASILIQLLDNNQLSELYNNLSKEKLMGMTQMALSMEITPKSEGELLQELKKYHNESPKSLISGHLGSILTQLPPSKENIIIDDLIAAERTDQLIQITKNFFPSRLINKIKDSILKEFCQILTTTQKAEFLLAVGEEDEFWQQTMAPEGSKIKEAIDLELGTMTSNESLVLNIRRNSDQIQFKFYSELREFLNQHYPKEMTDITSAWIAEDLAD